MRLLFALVLCLICSAADRGPRLYTVENYDVHIEPDLAARRLNGQVKIRLHSLADADISALELDSGEIQIDSVKEGQAAQWFEQSRGKVFVALTHPLRRDEPRTVTIAYRAAPAAGLRFAAGQIYASSVSDWMPCNEEPGERSTFRLTIDAPAGMKVAASGQLAGPGEWRLDSPAAPSWFGFALGNFVENTSHAGGVTLRALGATAAVFEPTSAAIGYLAERTGMPYPGHSYTEVFVHDGEARALAGGLTLLPESAAGDRFLLATELARQWYGVSIATKTSADSWLGAGISAFLADGFLGKEKSGQAMENSRRIYSNLRAEGKDRALSDADEAIFVNKAVVFLQQVNELLGDTVFAQGLKLYTSDAWGKTATSEDLQHAFDAVNTGKGVEKRGRQRTKAPKDAPNPLDTLFELWVFGILTTK